MDPDEPPAEQPLERWENLRQDGTYAPNPYLAEITADGVNLSHSHQKPLTVRPYRLLFGCHHPVRSPSPAARERGANGGVRVLQPPPMPE